MACHRLSWDHVVAALMPSQTNPVSTTAIQNTTGSMSLSCMNDTRCGNHEHKRSAPQPETSTLTVHVKPRSLVRGTDGSATGRCGQATHGLPLAMGLHGEQAVRHRRHAQAAAVVVELQRRAALPHRAQSGGQQRPLRGHVHARAATVRLQWGAGQCTPT